MIKGLIYNVIRLDKETVPEEVLTDIKDYLRIPNHAKEAALKEHRWGADRMDDEIVLWKSEGRFIALPRGFITRFTAAMNEATLDLYLTDETSFNTADSKAFEKITPIDLRDYQEDASMALMEALQGIYQGPTGSGKTVTMLETIRRLKERSIIIVNKANLVQQWSDACEKFLDYKPGFIGDGEWKEKEITIATNQTLHARREDLDRWWDQWGLVCLDECHAVTAETYQNIIEQFPAAYRFGISATPKKSKISKIADNVLGPIVHVTDRQDLYNQGILVKPKIFSIPTNFHYDFVPTSVDEDDKLVQRNNYSDVIHHLTTDINRTELVCDYLNTQRGHCCLVLSRRKIQLQYLADTLYLAFNYPKENILILTGEQSLEERMEVYERADSGNCVVFSTIADEAVDIPRIDRLHLVFPTKNTDLIRQQIGRGERFHPMKKEFYVYDYVDLTIGPLKKQYQDRKFNVYRAEGYEVKRLNR